MYRSKDGGATLEKVFGTGVAGTNGLDWITDLEIAGNGDLYAGVNSSGTWRSEASLGGTQGDGGTWTKLSITYRNASNSTGPIGRVEVAVGKSNSNYIYSVAEMELGGGAEETSRVVRSTDGGVTFANTPGQPEGGNDYSNGQVWYDICLEVDPNDENTLYTGAIDQYRSTNAGQSWVQLTSAYGGPNPYIHPDQHNIIINPDNSQEVIFANDGGIWYSNQRGSNPNAHNSGFNITQFYTLAIDPRPGSPTLLGGTQDNGTIKTLSNGISAGDMVSGGDGSYCAINHLDPDTLYTTSQYSTLRRSRNGGQNFQSISNPALDASNTLFINPIEIDPVNPHVLYQASNRLWRHQNATVGGGGGWQQMTAQLGGQITAIGLSTTPTNIVYFAANGTVYRIPNIIFAGSTYTPDVVNPSGAGSGYINCILVDPADGNHIFVAYASFGLITHVIESRDADQGPNATWKNLSGNLPDIPCNWLALEPNNANGLLVGTDMGIFRCADYSVNEADVYWSPESVGMGFPRVNMMRTRYSDNTVHAATHGRGFFSTDSYNFMPTADFGIESEDVCEGVVQFVDSTTSAPTFWSWDFGDGNTSTNQSPAHQYAMGGSYTVTLIVGNPNGQDTVTHTINVNVLPGITVNAGPDLGACPGDTVFLNATGGATYSWTPPVGLSDPNIADPYYVVVGTRTFIVEAASVDGCTDIDTIVVTQNTAPSLWAGADVTILAVNDSAQMGAAGADMYSWDPPTGLSCTNCQDPKAYPAVTTTYTVTGTNTNGCSRTDQVTVTVDIPIGASEAVDHPVGALYPAVPNPVTGAATLRFSLRKAADVQLELVSLQGQVVETLVAGRKAPGEHSIAWNREAELAAGVYFLRMRAGDAQFVQKVLVR
ncbi:MAG: PKD domain-containing protein, partial [Bacteroidota bacterium]